MTTSANRALHFIALQRKLLPRWQLDQALHQTRGRRVDLDGLLIHLGADPNAVESLKEIRAQHGRACADCTRTTFLLPDQTIDDTPCEVCGGPLADGPPTHIIDPPTLRPPKKGGSGRLIRKRPATARQARPEAQPEVAPPAPEERPDVAPTQVERDEGWRPARYDLDRFAPPPSARHQRPPPEGPETIIEEPLDGGRDRFAPPPSHLAAVAPPPSEPAHDPPGDPPPASGRFAPPAEHLEQVTTEAPPFVRRTWGEQLAQDLRNPQGLAFALGGLALIVLWLFVAEGVFSDSYSSELDDYEDPPATSQDWADD